MKKNALVAFIIGIVLGSATAWYYAKKRYEMISQEEINSVKEAFASKPTSSEMIEGEWREIPSEEEPKTAVEIARETDSLSKYARFLEKNHYVHYSKNEHTEPANESMDISDREKSKPYLIHPDKFGELEDYECIGFTYYSDGVLADDGDEKVKDIEDTVGSESLTYFGEYSDDAVYVRNDRLKIDYEILRDERTYEEILKNKPYLREV